MTAKLASGNAACPSINQSSNQSIRHLHPLAKVMSRRVV